MFSTVIHNRNTGRKNFILVEHKDQKHFKLLLVISMFMNFQKKTENKFTTFTTNLKNIERKEVLKFEELKTEHSHTTHMQFFNNYKHYLQ